MQRMNKKLEMNVEVKKKLGDGTMSPFNFFEWIKHRVEWGS